MRDDRVILLGILIAAVFLVISGRLFQLQVLEGSRWATQVERSRLVTEVLPARRGRILDRTGMPLADTRTVLTAAVVFDDLEAPRRMKRATPILRLDRHGFDALLADLTGRVRLTGGASLRELVDRELTDHPATTVRWLPARGDGTPVSIIAVARTALHPRTSDPHALANPLDGDDADESAILAEGDLLTEDPVSALAHDLGRRWQTAVEVIPGDDYMAACLGLDQAFDFAGASATAMLEPFAPAFTVDLPANAGGPRRLALRLLAGEPLAQGLSALARLAEVAPERVSERWQRLVMERRSQRAVVPTHVLYAAGSEAQAVAARLPPGTTAAEITVRGIPGERERVILLQGDPPDGDGCWSVLARRVAANLGIDAPLLQRLVELHAQVITPAKAAQGHGGYQLVLDPARLDRLADGLAEALTRAGQPTTRLEIDRRLAEARRIADRAWSGQTRSDPIALYEDLPAGLAARLDGRDAEPPADVLSGWSTLAQQEAAAPLPGLTIQRSVGRIWPLQDTLCHTLGTIGPAATTGQAASVGDQAPVGRWGLEATYDQLLRGLPGRRVHLRTPDGIEPVREDAPFDGRDVTTEIDLEVQSLAEDALEHQLDLARELGTATERMERAQAIGRGRSGFVLLDCHTGAILSLASNPRYRYSDLAKRYGELLKDPAQPLIDYAATPTAPPGSSFKILTALACLEYGVITPGHVIQSQGYMAMWNGRPVVRDHAPPGSYDLSEAIQVSSNVYFATIGARLGAERLTDIAWKVGIGRRNALDVFQQPPDNPRFLPTPAIIASIRPREPKWIANDTWRMSIGQFAVASPLQCACIAAAVANGGHIIRPYLVRPATPPPAEDLHIRQAWLDELRHGMELVTSPLPGSTARLLVLQGAASGIKVAAKTGTAEWGSARQRETGQAPDHAWMIGYAPADDPKVAFACFIHSGTFGGQACTPVVKRVLEGYFAKYGREGHR